MARCLPEWPLPPVSLWFITVSPKRSGRIDGLSDHRRMGLDRNFWSTTASKAHLVIKTHSSVLVRVATDKPSGWIEAGRGGRESSLILQYITYTFFVNAYIMNYIVYSLLNSDNKRCKWLCFISKYFVFYWWPLLTASSILISNQHWCYFKVNKL